MPKSLLLNWFLFCFVPLWQNELIFNQSATMLFFKISTDNSATRLGYFWKNLAAKFHSKVPKYLVTFWTQVKNYTFKVKSSLDTYWATFGSIKLLFNTNIWSHWLIILPGKIQANKPAWSFNSSEKSYKANYLMCIIYQRSAVGRFFIGELSSVACLKNT